MIQGGRPGKTSARGEVLTREQEEEHAALVAWRRRSPAAGAAVKVSDKEGGSQEIKMERLGKGADDGCWLDEDRSKGRDRSAGAGGGVEKGEGGKKRGGGAAGRGDRFRDRHPGEWELAYSACAGRAEDAGRWKDMEEDGVVIVLEHAKGWRPTERGKNKHYGDCDSPMGCACCRSDNNEAQGFCPVCDVAGKPRAPGPSAKRHVMRGEVVESAREGADVGWEEGMSGYETMAKGGCAPNADFEESSECGSVSSAQGMQREYALVKQCTAARVGEVCQQEIRYFRIVWRMLTQVALVPTPAHQVRLDGVATQAGLSRVVLPMDGMVPCVMPCHQDNGVIRLGENRWLAWFFALIRQRMDPPEGFTLQEWVRLIPVSHVPVLYRIDGPVAKMFVELFRDMLQEGEHGLDPRRTMLARAQWLAHIFMEGCRQLEF